MNASITPFSTVEPLTHWVVPDPTTEAEHEARAADLEALLIEASGHWRGVEGNVLVEVESEMLQARRGSGRVDGVLAERQAHGSADRKRRVGADGSAHRHRADRRVRGRGQSKGREYPRGDRESKPALHVG